MQQFKVKYGSDPQGFYWPASDQKRQELYRVKRNSPDAYESTYQCRPGERQGSIFLADDFNYYQPPSGLGLGTTGYGVAEFLKPAHGVFAAWDTAFSQTSDSAFTCAVVGAFFPCQSYHRGEDASLFGPCEQHFDVAILDVMREKLDWGALVKSFRGLHAKWLPEIHIVEKRASGISLFQSMNSAGLPIRGVDVKDGKVGRAINGTVAGSVQGWFRQHRVLFPTHAPWLDVYRAELKDFTGEDDDLSDQVDGTVHLITHAINIGSQTLMLPTGELERVDKLPIEQMLAEQIADMLPGQHPGLQIFGMLEAAAFNPFQQTCQFCKRQDKMMCQVQKRRVVAMDSCPAWADEVPDA